MSEVDADQLMVRFRGVFKTYDGRIAVVRDLDLDVRRGEFLTLLGPSGSGKTTTLMMLAGFETPTGGTIEIEGRPVNSVPPHRRDIGMVFQNYALFPHMTVAENVAFPLSVRGIAGGDKDRRVERALDMVRLGGFGHRRPAQLSGGQQQRVALARALVFEPKLVLMDEPLGALDKQLREHMQLEIKHLHRNLGVTMVYVTHDQSEALTLSDRIAVFNDGRIQQIDPPARLYDEPRTAFVANFIGENNMLTAAVQSVGNGLAEVRLGDGSIVKARPIAVDSAGTPCRLSFRPERARVLANGESPSDGWNRIEAEFKETIYHGDHRRLRLAIGSSDEITVKATVGPASSPDPQEGARVAIAVRAEDCLALDAPPGK